jgi:polyisoprenoid-binding protein YceI
MDKRLLIAGAAAALVAACGKPKTETASAEAAAPAAEAAAEPAPVAVDLAPQPAFDASVAPAGVYKTDPRHAYITFSYDHQGYSRPWVRWRAWTGELNWNPSAPEQSTITATIDASSADSGVDAFDEHLESADFFDAANHPEISFKSTSISLAGGAKGTMAGDLTIKGVTKPVTLDVTINKAANDDFAKAYKLGFSAKGLVKRSDFGVDKYVPFVGDEVTVVIETEWTMPRAEEAAAQ